MDSINKVVRIQRFVALALALLMLPFLFQNCSVLDSGSSDPASKSSGNGEPYSGIQAKPGDYFYVVDDSYECALGIDIELNNIAKTLKVRDGSEVAVLEDHCSGSELSIPLSAVSVSAFNHDLVGILDLTFQFLDEPDKVRERLQRPIARCYEKTRTAREYFVFRSVDSQAYFAEVYERGGENPRYVDLVRVNSQANQLTLANQAGDFELIVSREISNSDSSSPSTVLDSASLAPMNQPQTEPKADPISCFIDKN